MVSAPIFIRQFPLKQLVLHMRLAAMGMLLCSGIALADELTTPYSQQQLDQEFADAQSLDWVELDKLTEAQKKALPISCCGAYIAPVRIDPDARLLPKNAPIHGYSEETKTEQQNQLELSGNVSITQGNRSLTTERATFDQETHQAQLSGGVQMFDPGVKVVADSAQINTESGEAKLNNAKFVLYETRIHGVAKQLHKFGDNIINLENSQISSCEPGDNAWSIRGSEITLHPDEHYGTAENMRVNIKDVPVIYMPYVRFPVGSERLTGFLFPSITHSSRNGWDAAIPFYWNIAPQLDATITARNMSERGAMLDTNVRHLSPHFKTEFNVSFINNDNGGFSRVLEEEIKAGTITEQEAYPYRGRNRWYANLNQTGGLGEAWATKIDYADLSDKDYLRDMYSNSIDSDRNAYITQMASFDYRTDHWFMGIKSNEYRLLTSQQLHYRELPRIHLDGHYQADDWVFKLNNEYVNFIKNRYLKFSAESPESLAKIIYGERFNTDYSATWNKSYPWGFVKPTVGFKGLRYQFDASNLNAGADSSPVFTVPQAALDAGLYFERDADLLGGHYLQTLEPRAFYFHSNYKDQQSLYGLTGDGSYVNFDTAELTFNYNQLFRTTRFAGGDRLDDANQLSLGISSALISQTSGLERLRVSLGEIFYADNRRVTVFPNNQSIFDNTRPNSDLVAQVNGQLNQRVRVNTDLAYDQRNGRLDTAEASIHYIDDAYRIFNIAYRYNIKPIASNPSQLQDIQQTYDQLDTSVILPLASRWSLIARHNHDFTYGVELDTFAGLEYNDCCYRARIISRRWLRIDYTTSDFLSKVTSKDYEPVVMFELELKGLGSIDQRISSLLDKAVSGFKEREKNLR